MSHNSFGHLFRVTTWGESHGPAIGCVVDGCPPSIALSEADIQPFLDRRRPGQSKFTTQRQEPDEVRILSGVFDGKTTGTPIALEIQNVDQRSKDYGNIAQSFRPGHADLTYTLKYGIRDHRGGGRASARETAMRVAAGAIARKLLPNITIRGALTFASNHAGGILGGISTGQPIVARFAVKPTSSILSPRRSINTDGEAVEVVTKGRHDPCVGIRAVPVGEAMMALVLADHLLRHRGQVGGSK